MIDDGEKEEPRALGLAMIPGHYIASIHVDSFPVGVGGSSDEVVD